MKRMFIKSLIMALWLQLILATPTLAMAPEPPCQWSQAAQLIHKRENELHQIWHFAENPVFWSGSLPHSPSLERFRQQVQALIPELEPSLYYQQHPPATDGEAYNQLLAASGQAGTLQPINCLEALLLSEQTARLPMLQKPSEFGAFILRRQPASGPEHYKVYFSTQDQPGLRMNPEVMSLIEQDRQAGWRVWTHLHNHNFFLEKADPFASPSPSKTDVEFARMLQKSMQLENLWVTNGFHTLHLTQAEFQLFRGHSDADAD